MRRCETGMKLILEKQNSDGHARRPLGVKETKERAMRWTRWAVLLLMLGFASTARAQMGMDLFKKPSFTKVFHPVVGKGAQYETAGTGGSQSTSRTMELGIVGKESVDGKDGYWMQFVVNTDKGQTMVGKALMTSGDFQIHRMIFQPAGQGAMEMPINPSAAHKGSIEEAMENWQSVGTETITVPAGTFSCEHWKNEKNGAEVWSSDKVSPFGMVKQTGKDSSMVLLKILSDVPDRITGPVQKFDPQIMMQQMQQQQQQQRQQPKP
jgi:hypothetical protein